MTSILTNKLNIQVFHENLYSDYKVVEKELEKENFQKRGLSIRRLKKEISPIAFIVHKEKLIYLLEKNAEIKDEESKKLPLFEFKKIPSYILLNLLLKLLAQEEVLFDIDASFNKVYYMVKESKGLIQTVEFYIDKNNLFDIKGVAFKKYVYDKSNKYTTPTYIKEGQILLPKDAKETKKQLYEKRNYKGKKLTVDYFSKSRKKYHLTKSYFAGVLLKSIKTHLNKYVKIDFTQMNMDVKIKYNYNYVNKKDKELITLAQNKIHALNIINTTDIVIDKFISIIQNVLKNTKINVVEKPQKNSFNLIFTYEKEYYELKKKADPYIDMKKIDLYSQSYQIDEKLSLNTHKVRASIKELLIKNDIKNKKITLAEDTGIKHIYFLKKHDKTYYVHQLSFKNQELNYSILTSGEKYKLLINKTWCEHGNYEVIIEDYQGNISAIIDTKMYAIVNYEGIYDYYKEDDPSGVWNPIRKKDNESKKQKAKYHLIYSLFGVKTFTIGRLEGYIPGRYDNTDKFSKNYPGRIIYPLSGESINIDIILSSLEHYFIRNKDMTVMPYQLKYLREMIKLEELKSKF